MKPKDLSSKELTGLARWFDGLVRFNLTGSRGAYSIFPTYSISQLKGCDSLSIGLEG